MSNMQLTRIPVTETAMLIRKPVGEVFEAVANPEITTKFWFTKGSGRLEEGKEVEWQWEMYEITIPVVATVVEPNRRIVMQWPGHEGLNTVEWRFAPQADGTTFLSVSEAGFSGSGDELVEQVTGSTGGFSLVLAGLKAYLEHGIQLNLVADRFPPGIVE